MDETTAVTERSAPRESSEEGWADEEYIGLPALLWIVVAGCVFATIFLVCLFCCCCVRNRKSKQKSKDNTRHLQSKSMRRDNSYLNVAVPPDGHVSSDTRVTPKGKMQNDIMDKLEDAMKKQLDNFCMSSDRLIIGGVIGSGRFGVVYKAELTDKDLKNPTEVAAKTVQGEDCHEKEVSDFLEEVLRMRGFHNKNVLSMTGLVLRENKPYAILPFMQHGDLRGYLKDKSKRMVVRELVDFCHQIAEGMTYLSEQNFVHRDLAARNCMVDEDSTVKIADFGLSRDLYKDDYYRMSNLDQPLPVRWMAVESIVDKKFTVKSDVWSFGVVMWEVMTRGQTPFSDREPPQVVGHIKAGGKLEKPQYCPDEVFTVMRRCWKDLPEDRPDFRELTNQLSGMLSEPRSKVQKKADKYYNLTEIEAANTAKKPTPQKGKGAKGSKSPATNSAKSPKK